jgi:hypothetical protein
MRSVAIDITPLVDWGNGRKRRRSRHDMTGHLGLRLEGNIIMIMVQLLSEH